MATLPTDEAIQRFKDNENRVDIFVNSNGFYETNETPSRQVETLPSFSQRISDEFYNTFSQLARTVPVAYTSGISLTTSVQTIEYSGVLYQPKLSSLPFTTSGTWVGDDENKFEPIQLTDSGVHRAYERSLNKIFAKYLTGNSDLNDAVYLILNTVVNISVGTVIQASFFDSDELRGSGAEWFCVSISATAPDAVNGINSDGCFYVGSFKFEPIPFLGMVSVLWFGAKASGDESSIFKAAFNSIGNKIVVPNIGFYYQVKDLTFPSGKTLVGVGRKKVYDISSISDLEGTCAIVKVSGGDWLIEFEAKSQVEGLNLCGRDKTQGGLGKQTGSNIVAKSCSFQYFNVGIGKKNGGTIIYTGNSRFYDCHANQNFRGLSALIDSHVVSYEINANDDYGVYQPSGSNDTTFEEGKNEWNGNSNWHFYQSSSNIVNGGVCDRSGGSYGAEIRSCTVQFSAVKFRRNGRDDVSTSSHFYIQSGTLVLSNLSTATGANDDSSGNTTPARIFTVGGATSASTIVVVGSNLEGYTTTLKYIGSATLLNKGCLGLPDSIENIATGSGTVAGSTLAKSVDLSNYPVSTYSNSSVYSIVVKCRDATSGSHYFKKFGLMLRREGGSATAVLIDAYGSSQIAQSAATVLNLTVDSIASDGTSLNLNFEGVSGNSIQFSYKIDFE